MSNIEEMEYCEKNSAIARRFTTFSYDVEFESKNNFDLLPDEVILKIFTFLSFWELRLPSMVCKRWYSLSFDAKLWKNVILSSRELSINSLERILNCGVEFFELDCSTIIEEEVREEFFKSVKFGNLQKLSISCTEIKMELLEELLALVPYLKVLTLESACDEISCKAFKYMNKMKLEELNFMNCTIAYEAFLDCQNFRELRRMNLLNFLGVEDLLHICPNLELIDVASFEINSCILNEIVQMKNLEELSLDSADMEAGDLGMLDVLENCDNMDKLHCLRIGFNFYNFITLDRLLLRCSCLTELTLSEVDINYGIYEKILRMKRLQTLSLWEINIIIHNSVTDFKFLKNYDAFASLQNLSISFKLFGGTCYEVETLIRLSPYLKQLSVDNCSLSESIFEYISTLSDLEALSIPIGKYCAPISSDRISAILKGCPKLVGHNLLTKYYKKQYIDYF